MYRSRAMSQKCHQYQNVICHKCKMWFVCLLKCRHLAEVSVWLQVLSSQCNLAELCSEAADEAYMIAQTENAIHVILSRSSKAQNLLKAFVHAHVLIAMEHQLQVSKPSQVTHTGHATLLLCIVPACNGYTYSCSTIV